MSSSGLALAPIGRQEISSAQGRVDGPCVKAGQRVALGVLTKNDHRSRSNQGIPAQLGSAMHSVPAHGNDAHSYQSSSAFGVWEAEPDVVQAAQPTGNQIAVSVHLSEMQILSAVNDFTSGSSLDASMQSLPEEEPVTSEDILSVADYADDIHQHLRESELRYRSKPGYMSKQPDINNSMRVILVD
ncbi:hypothetical protein QTP70_020027 [Hemibagrus guttatus]|uniref:Uncharacterized protein n=1 Tax=Hemibagrus guttatus TaxID=175788 RepID=A0AAE0QIS6_9TELE|nr:hypothetical protein QTP70_020027 [Hemibagrus guttatus]